MLGLLKRRRAALRLAAEDAQTLVDAYGPEAYAEALQRDTRAGPTTIDANRPVKHWVLVRHVLRRDHGFDPDRREAGITGTRHQISP